MPNGPEAAPSDSQSGDLLSVVGDQLSDLRSVVCCQLPHVHATIRLILKSYNRFKQGIYKHVRTFKMAFHQAQEGEC